MRKRWLIATIGILISLIFLWIAFRNLHPQQVWDSMRQANPFWLTAGVIWYFPALAVISLRWQYLLNAIQRIPLWNLIQLVCIGYAGNNIYPFRSGELLRIVLLQRNHGVAFARGTTTVVIERVFDGLVLLTFILIPLLIRDVASPEIRTMASVATPLFLIALAVFFVLAARPDALRRLYGLVGPWLLPKRLYQPVSDLVEDVINGLDGLRSPADLAGTILSSYGTWALQGSVFWLVGQALDLHTDFVTMLLAVGAVNLAGLIPASPGQFGVFETFASAVLIADGVPQTQAVAFGLTVHLVIWLPVTLVGLYFLLRQGLQLSAITRAERLEQNSLESAEN